MQDQYPHYYRCFTGDTYRIKSQGAIAERYIGDWFAFRDSANDTVISDASWTPAGYWFPDEVSLVNADYEGSKAMCRVERGG